MDTSISHHIKQPSVSNSSKLMPNLYSKIITTCQSSEIHSTPENNSHMRSLMKSRPLSSVKKRVFYNPFNQNLKEKLENPTFSPTVFSIVVSPSQDSTEFKWAIEDISRINPAPIEEEFIHDDVLDEETEGEIQKTIEKYFSGTHMVLSPWDCKLPTRQNLSPIHKKDSSCSTTDDRCNVIGEVSPYFDIFPHNSMQNCSTQTALSLPANLPPELESVLKPYFSQHMNLDEGKYDNVPCLPRKLFFQTEDEPLSPVRFVSNERSPILSGSIFPVSKTYYPSTPVLKSCTIGTPLQNNLSPIDISPISCTFNNKCNDQSSVVSLMQVDTSSFNEKKLSIGESVSKRTKNEMILEECSKIFDSPKGIHRRTKRRKILEIVSEMSSYKMDVDLTSSACMESQDTGYNTDFTKSNFNKNADISGINFSKLKMSVSNQWDEEDKENIFTASTPTKKFAKNPCY